MTKNFLTVSVVILITVTLFYLSHQSNKLHQSDPSRTTRIVIIPLDITSGSESIIEGKIESINSLLNSNATIQELIIFVETDEQGKGQSYNQHRVILNLLWSIKSNPTFVFGENFSKDPNFDLALEPHYELLTLTPKSTPWVNIIKVDSTDLLSKFILQFTHSSYKTDTPGLTIYNDQKEPQKQFNWLSSLVGATSNANIVITQESYYNIDEKFQKKLLTVVCSSRISLFVYMSKQENQFWKRLCPGNSFAMLGAPEHYIGFLGLQSDDVEYQGFRYATIDIDQNGINITYNIL